MSAIDLDAFRATRLEREPYDHLVVSGFLRPDAMRIIGADYPEISKAGSYPLSELKFGPAFAALIEEMRTPEMEDAFADKFDIDLAGRPIMVTVRGQCRAKDGRIHTDSKTKLITVLIYMNVTWPDPGGHLRLLRSAKTLDDFFAEVQPAQANAVVFRCRDNAWHGHTPFVGERRVIQLNWVMDEAVVRREQRRHGFSAKLKRWWRSERRR